jgi:hypothetical protein
VGASVIVRGAGRGVRPSTSMTAGDYATFGGFFRRTLKESQSLVPEKGIAPREAGVLVIAG